MNKTSALRRKPGFGRKLFAALLGGAADVLAEHARVEAKDRPQDCDWTDTDRPNIRYVPVDYGQTT